MASVVPRVVLLDIDGTMIGKISPIACQYELLSTFSKKGGLAAAKTDIIQRLKYGIIRPHLDTFCKAASSNGIELFIYTASEAKWAAFLVPCIEAAMNVKFNRPIFTRSHCKQVVSQGVVVDHEKSIEGILPSIFRTLKRSHTGLTNIKLLADRVVLVDNTANVLSDPSRMILCPTYSYTYVFDVLNHMDINMLHRRIGRVSQIVSKFGLLQPLAQPFTNYQQFSQAYFERLSRAVSDASATNVVALQNDKFWQVLAHAINTSRARIAFDAAGIASIHAYMASHYYNTKSST